MLQSKKNFPTLANNPNLAYFDSAASTQTHNAVLKAMNNYYCNFRSNTNRGEYDISEQTSNALDIAKQQVADLINVSTDNLVFTSGTTQGLNIVSKWMKSAQRVILTEAEHNANIVPWLAQGKTQENGGISVLPINDFDGLIDLFALEKLLEEDSSGKTIVSFCATSNVTGVMQPWQAIADLSHKYGATVCVDFCQSIAHSEVDLTETPVEFAVFSAHKMYGPTGIGVLYSSFDFDELTPQYFGGGAVESVTFDSVSLRQGINKHCPGTPDIANIIGFGVACMLGFAGFLRHPP